MLNSGAETSTIEPVLRVSDVSVRLGRGRGAHNVLHGVSMAVGRGRTTGLVGESGSGKSTLARAAVGVNPILRGSITIGGVDLAMASRAERSRLRRQVQLVPQDPYLSLNPRRTIGQSIAEALDPIRANPCRDRDRIRHWLEVVELPADSAERYPHEFSGGQRQRIAIARALSLEPDLVIADEITSALDVSVQATVLDLLADLRARFGLTMLFITHNLAVVQQVCDDVVVLQHGRVVEQGPVDEVFWAPESDYTRTLLDSVPGSPTFTLSDTPGGSAR